MDAIEETPWQADQFRNQSLLYLYCVDLSYVFELTIPSLPFLKLKCVFGHVSFPSSLSERRMVVLPRSHKLFSKLKDITSCVIETISSVDFEVVNLFFLYSIDLVRQIHPEEVEEDKSTLLIWDFQLQETNLSVTSSRCLLQPKIPSAPNNISSMPLLDLTLVDRNCSNFLRRGNVLLENVAQGAARGIHKLSICENNRSQDDEVNVEENLSEEEDEEDFDFDSNVPDTSDGAREFIPDESGPSAKAYEESCTLFTETFTLKGSSFHEHFQCGLEMCKEELIKKNTVPVKLVYEPINRRDENAILVHTECDNTWRPIGYIPGIKVPKVTQAIEDEEITKIVITNVKYQFIFPISSFKYFATISITKKGKWRKNRDSYKYNEDI